MGYYITLAFIATILIPTLTGTIRYKKINTYYHPFIWYLWLGTLNEAVSQYCNFNYGSNVLNYNICTLLNSVLVVWIFHKWGLFRSLRIWPVMLTIGLCAGWFVENFIIGNIKAFNSWFTIISAFLISIMATVMLNRLFFNERKRLLTNPIFLICIAMVFMYTYLQLAEIFSLYSINLGTWSKYFYRLFVYSLAFNYLLFTIAILCMKRKLPFTRLS